MPGALRPTADGLSTRTWLGSAWLLDGGFESVEDVRGHSSTQVNGELIPQKSRQLRIWRSCWQIHRDDAKLLPGSAGIDATCCQYLLLFIVPRTETVPADADQRGTAVVEDVLQFVAD